MIGAPDAVMASVMAPLSERLRTNAPHVDIGLVHLMPGQGRGSEEHPWQGSLEKLEKREIDVAHAAPAHGAAPLRGAQAL